MVAVRGLFFLSLIALALGKPTARNMKLHESRESIPRGFSLRGPAHPDQTLNLRIALVQNNVTELERRLMDVSTPSSANYGKHLSKAEVEQLVAPAPDGVDAINAWLKENDIDAQIISPAGDWLSFKVPVSKADELFDAKFSVFTHEKTGTEAVRTLSYSIPVELQGHLDLVYPTITFPNPTGLRPVFSAPIKAEAHELTSRAIPASCNSTITPTCLQAIYGIPTTPATQSSNRLGVSGFINQWAEKADLFAFLKNYRTDIPPSTTFETQRVDGGVNPQLPAAGGTEADLDIQYTVGIATGVPTVFITVGQNNTDGDLQGFLDIINFLLAQENPPLVLTTSYGENEDGISLALANRLCTAFKELGARGVSILFASGDGGVSGSQSDTCTQFVPTFPSGCPFMTSVGATQGVNPETAANFSSGGFSNYFPIPEYQASAVSSYLKGLNSTNSGKYNASGRGFPDVSAQGVNFDIILNGLRTGVSGTSCSSPVFASVIALINDRLIAAGKSPLGFLNPFLYSPAGMAALNDITSGDNPGCGTDGFPATAGWDPVTGLGTPNFAALLEAVGL